MKTNKGFIVPLLLGVIALLVIGGGMYIYQNKKAEAPLVINTQIEKSKNETQAISVISPSEEERWLFGTTQVIKWEGLSSNYRYDIYAGAPLPSKPSGNFIIAKDVPGNSYDWKVGYSYTGNIMNLSDRGENLYLLVCEAGSETNCDSNHFGIDIPVKAGISLDMANQYAKTYKTLFTTEFAKEANFDGHFRVVAVGCGSNCAYLYALDKNNGKVYKVSTEAFDDYSILSNQIRAKLRNSQYMYIFDSLKDEFSNHLIILN